MSLPPTLQASTTPHELEFIAMEDTIEIVPLFSMDRIRLLSVSYDQTDLAILAHDALAGCIWTVQTSSKGKNTSLDGCQPQGA